MSPSDTGCTEMAAACLNSLSLSETRIAMNWYCVHTRPLKEQQVATHFHQMLGLRCISPVSGARRPSAVRRVVTSPLFPR